MLILQENLNIQHNRVVKKLEKTLSFKHFLCVKKLNLDWIQKTYQTQNIFPFNENFLYYKT